MTQTWKAPHILKGLLTHVPALNRLRQRRAATAGTDSARYCYSVWLRHLSILGAHGFRVDGADVGELGPGDSIGIGLAALLSGAKSYVGLDVVPFSANADLGAMLDELVACYARREAIPNEREFPRVRPRLESYAFPAHIIDCSGSESRAAAIAGELKNGLNNGSSIHYKAPWHTAEIVRPESLDLIFSQAVLEHVDDLEGAYAAMSAWLRPGGYASHVIDFGAHNLSPYWNGHRAYTDLEWELVRGRREFLLNRQPLSEHLRLAKEASFHVAALIKEYDDAGIAPDLMAPQFRVLDAEDRRTRGCLLIFRKM